MAKSQGTRYRLGLIVCDIVAVKIFDRYRLIDSSPSDDDDDGDESQLLQFHYGNKSQVTLRHVDVHVTLTLNDGDAHLTLTCCDVYVVTETGTCVTCNHTQSHVIIRAAATTASTLVRMNESEYLLTHVIS